MLILTSHLATGTGFFTITKTRQVSEKTILMSTEASPRIASVPSTAGNGIMASLLPSVSGFFSSSFITTKTRKQRLQRNVILEKKRNG